MSSFFAKQKAPTNNVGLYNTCVEHKIFSSRNLPSIDFYINYLIIKQKYILIDFLFSNSYQKI